MFRVFDEWVRSGRLFTPKKCVVKLEGHVRGYQTYMEGEEDTGIVVPRTEMRGRNTIKTDLKKYLAYNIAVPATVNQAMDNLINSETLSDIDGRDGIMYDQSEAQTDAGTDITKALITTLNDGGDNVDEFAEFYGYLTGAATLAGYFVLGFDFDYAGGSPYHFEKVYATYAVSASVAASRRYHFYWKITLS